MKTEQLMVAGLVVVGALVAVNLYINVKIAQGLQGIAGTVSQVGNTAGALGNLFSKL